MLSRWRSDLAMLAGAAALVSLFSDFKTKRLSKTSGAWLASFAALNLLKKPLSGYRGLSVVITGGSRGLGFALAECLLKNGAFVTLIARNPDELAEAKEKLEAFSTRQLFTVVADVTNCPQLDEAFAEAKARFKKIDVLINNAGAISVAPFQTLSQLDFEAQLRLHVEAPIQATRLIRPYFHQVGRGRIVNISSLGGLIALPHMSAYSASKFALGGFSEAVGAELASENITVTTVYPGLMRTGSPIQAVFKGAPEKEFAWFAAADQMPLLTVSANSAAHDILSAALEGRRQLVVSLPAKAAKLLHALAPETFLAASEVVANLLPKGDAKVAKTGAEARRDMKPNPISDAVEQTAKANEERLNQKESFNADFNLGV